jgi:hypothetical protein
LEPARFAKEVQKRVRPIVDYRSVINRTLLRVPPEPAIANAIAVFFIAADETLA